MFQQTDDIAPSQSIPALSASLARSASSLKQTALALIIDDKLRTGANIDKPTSEELIRQGARLLNALPDERKSAFRARFRKLFEETVSELNDPDIVQSVLTAGSQRDAMLKFAALGGLGEAKASAMLKLHAWKLYPTLLRTSPTGAFTVAEALGKTLPQAQWDYLKWNLLGMIRIDSSHETNLPTQLADAFEARARVISALPLDTGLEMLARLSQLHSCIVELANAHPNLEELLPRFNIALELAASTFRNRALKDLLQNPSSSDSVISPEKFIQNLRIVVGHRDKASSSGYSNIGRHILNLMSELRDWVGGIADADPVEHLPTLINVFSYTIPREAGCDNPVMGFLVKNVYFSTIRNQWSSKSTTGRVVEKRAKDVQRLLNLCERDDQHATLSAIFKTLDEMYNAELHALIQGSGSKTALEALGRLQGKTVLEIETELDNNFR